MEKKKVTAKSCHFEKNGFFLAAYFFLTFKIFFIFSFFSQKKVFPFYKRFGNAKMSQKYYCEICDYKTAKKTDFERHCSTRKHLHGANGNILETHSITSKTSKNAQLNHSEGRIFSKPKNEVKTHKKNEKNEKKTKKHQCLCCKKSYNSRSGLWKHQQVCFMSVPPGDEDDETTNIVVELLKDNNDFKHLILEQTQQIRQIQEDNQQLQSQLLIAMNDGRMGNTTHITNHNNQKFNLNFFLNEQCKDAMNIEDFIDSLDLEPCDIAETGRLGYVEGISRIFINKLNELDMYSRPLHCTDLKRETLYIKEDNKWEKDNEQKEKLKSIVTQIAEKNYQQLPLWQSENPSHIVTDTPECELFMDIACNSLGGGSSEESNRFNQRIMRNVLKEITLSKIV